MKSHSILFVSPVLRASSQGRDSQTYNYIDPKTKELKKGERMNKTREFGTEVVLKFLIDFNKNKYVTGLDELIPNPFLDLSEEEVRSTYNLSSKWTDLLPKIIKQSQISRQTYFEILDNVDPDFYTSTVKGPTMFNFQPYQLHGPEKAEPSFISRFSVVFFDRPNRFTDETPRQRMAMQLIKNHPSIALNKSSANPAEHLFYISEENEAEMEKMRKQDVIDAANYSKYKLQTESPYFMNYKVASLLTTHQGTPLITGVSTPDQVKQAINNFMNDRQYQMENIGKFMTIMDLLKTSEGKQRFEIKYLVRQAFNARVMENSNGYIVWKSRSASNNVYKWTDYEKLVSFLVSDMIVYDPESTDTSVTNWYNELFEEVKAKNVWVE